MKKTSRKDFRESFGRAFQTKLVRVLYQNPKFIPVVRNVIKFEFFETKRLQWVVGRLYYAYDHEDRATRLYLKRELKEHVEYGTVEKEDARRYQLFIDKLLKKVPDKNYIQEKVGEFAKYSKLKQGLYKAAVALEEKLDIDAAQLEVRRLEQLLKKDESQIDSSEFRRYIRNYIKKGPVKLITGVPTGMDSVDMNLGGHRGMPPGRLGTIIAGTGRGKTLALTNFGVSALVHFCNLDEPKVVLHLTGEDDLQSMYFRYQASLMNMPLKEVKRKKYLDRFVRKYKRLNSTLGKGWEDHLIIREFDFEEISAYDIEGMCLQLEEEGRPVGLVICDYADLLRAEKEKRRDATWDVLGNVYKECRGVARRRKVPFWTGSQVERKVQGAKRVRLKNMGGAIKKAEVSDVILAIEQTDQEKFRGKGRLRVEKVRFGKDKFDIQMDMDYECQRLIDQGIIEEYDDVA